MVSSGNISLGRIGVYTGLETITLVALGEDFLAFWGDLPFLGFGDVLECFLSGLVGFFPAILS